MSNATRKIFGDIQQCERDSDRRINPSNYYVVKVTLTKGSLGDPTWYLKENDDALVCYVGDCGNEWHLLYSSVDDDKQHRFGGSHHAICSYFASNFALKTGDTVNVNIVELENRTKVLVYFQTKIVAIINDKMIELSKGAITRKNIEQYTHSEMVSMLKKKGVDWGTINAGEKFGTIYKLGATGSSKKPKVETLTEMINFVDIERYTKFFFSGKREVA